MLTTVPGGPGGYHAFYVGFNGAWGYLNVTNNSTVTSNNFFVATGSDYNSGDPAAGGTITVSTGGTLSAAGLRIGYGDQNQGDMTISDAGSLASFTGESYVGFGGSSTANLYLNGGTMATSGRMVVGYNGTGTVTQTGGLFTNSAGAIYVSGYESEGTGTGSYNLNGGTLSGLLVVGSNGAGSLNQTAGEADVGLLFVGYYATAAGSVTLSGGTFNDTGDLTMGKNGATSSGTVSVEGTAQCTTSGIRVGEWGNGRLIVKDTASLTVNAPDYAFSVASNPGSNGYVDQSGGTCSVGGNGMNIGEGGAGTYALSGGLLQFTAANITSTAATPGVLAVSGGTLDMGSGTIDAVDVQFSGGTLTNASSVASNIALSGASAVINNDTTDGTISGVISGEGAGFTKVGAGKLILSNANTYTGDTSVQVGALSVTGSLQSNVNVSAGAVLGGSGSVKSVNGVAGAILAPDDPSTLTIAGDLTWAGTLETLYDGGDAQPVSLVAVAGNVDATGATFDFTQTGAALTLPSYTFLTYGGTFTGSPAVTNLPGGYHVEYLSGSVILAVPEPSTLALLACGLFGLIAYAWRKRK